MGYVLGSYFAWKCNENRKKHMVKLLDAENPYIRVAGAVYLCFEDEKLGVKKLRKLTKLKSDPGVWAAINLVRRGDKSAMPRAMEVFDEMGSSNMAGVPHGNLQKRLLVLISNSCAFSGIPMPKLKFGEKDPVNRQLDKRYITPEQAKTHNMEWWHANKDKIIINDPWLQMLTEQKVD